MGGWAAGGQMDGRCVGGPLTWLPPYEEDRAGGSCVSCHVSQGEQGSSNPTQWVCTDVRTRK